MLVALAAGCGGRIDAGDTLVDASPPVDAAAPEASAPIDASPVETGPAPDAGFTPASLGNLALWLDATALVQLDGSGNVAAWGDRSTFGNDAAASPEYAPSLAPSAVNGQPAIHFDASSAVARYLLVVDSPSLRWGTGDYLVAVVGRFTNEPSDGLATGAASFFWKSTFPTGAGVSVVGNVPLANGTVSDGLILLEDASHYDYAKSAYHDGVAHLFVARRTAGSLELRVDGASVASSAESSPADVSAVGVPVSIGAVSFAYYRLFGDIAEIVALSGPSAPGDIDALESYFAQRYALP